jgi:hypothetical protein
VKSERAHRVSWKVCAEKVALVVSVLTSHRERPGFGLNCREYFITQSVEIITNNNMNTGAETIPETSFVKDMYQTMDNVQHDHFPCPFRQVFECYFTV